MGQRTADPDAQKERCACGSIRRGSFGKGRGRTRPRSALCADCMRLIRFLRKACVLIVRWAPACQVCSGAL